MKQLFTYILVYLVSISAYSQSHKDVLTAEVNTYFDYMTNQEFDGVLDYMYPKVFEMASRDEMKIGMEQMLNAEDMKIEFLANDVTKVTDKKSLNGVDYAAIFYSSKMKMTFLTEEGQAEEDKKGFLMFMKATMQTQFGDESVVDELETMSLIIDMKATMFAINDPQYKGWKFLGNDDAMKSIVNAVIPESIRTELLNEKE